jgi:hypothetical protein
MFYFQLIRISEVLYIYIVTCLRHAAIVETEKSVNTLRNNRGSGVYSVPCRAAGGRAVPSQAESSRTAPRSFPRQHRCKHGDDATVLFMNPLLDDMTWPDATELTGSVFRFAVSGYISEAASNFSSVLRSEFAESVLGERFMKISQSARSVNWGFDLKCVMKTVWRIEGNIGV